MTDSPVENSPRAAGSSYTSHLSLLVGLVLFASLLVLTGCALFGPNTFLSDRDTDVKDATHAIETAGNDVQRAKGYSSRGVAYSEKARFGRATKQMPHDEYERLFNLAIKDHDQAIALDPNSTEVYFNRAQAYYDRAAWDLVEKKDSSKSWFDAAAADFEKAIEKDQKNKLAFDRLGLTYEQNGEPDKAVQAYTHELAFDSFGKQRLADLYCNIGFQHEQEKDYTAASAAYRKSIDFGTADDKSCPVPLPGQLRWIEQQKKESARTN